MRSLAILSLLLIYTGAAYAISGEGCDKSRQKAVKYALGELSQQIEVHVTSELRSTQSSMSDSYYSYSVRTRSELPILGHTVTTDGECVTASMDAKTVAPFYMDRAESLSNEIDALTDLYAKEGRKNATYLNEALRLYSDFSGIATVCSYFGFIIRKPKLTLKELEVMLAERKRVSADINELAYNILNSVKLKPLYVYTPTLYDSQTVTPFSAALKHLLTKDNINPDDAKYRLNCLYEPNSPEFAVSCQVIDKIGVVLQTTVIYADGKICETLSCTPKNMDKALEAMKSGIKGYFYTESGPGPLTYRGGDIIRLYCRLQAPSEVALLHVIGDELNIIPINNKLVEKITAHTENELIALKVSPPYGEETLILATAGSGLEKLLPVADFDNEKNVYTIKGKASLHLKSMNGKVNIETLFIYTGQGI
jgi:hypothetical protein